MLDTHFRQGDVLLIAVGRLPSDVKLVPIQAERSLALVADSAGGVGTHLVASAPAVRAFGRPGAAQVDWLQVSGEPVVLTHPEHGSLTLDPGTWQVVRQREYEPQASVHHHRLD